MSILIYLLIYVIGVIFTFALTGAMTTLSEKNKITSLYDFTSKDFITEIWLAIFWPILILILPIAIIFFSSFFLFKLFQWILFEIFKPKENV